MKPRRRLLSVDLLPTISETQEDAAHAWHPGHAGHPSASLEDYVASIKELAQPAAFSACATLRVPGRRKHALPAAPPPGAAAAACKPRLPVALDDIALVFGAGAKGECGGSCAAARDPLDWLFARAEECDGLSLPETSAAALCLL
ncbi:protein DEPP [Anguilla anguilla]|uniref:protein DEPP n=1 Tax=Anguilla anguilla TaxID=7936 RepID=UPI0015A91294|nr:protein DEPP [Anguilla anguilla]